jgi:hypothetical protein
MDLSLDYAALFHPFFGPDRYGKMQRSVSRGIRCNSGAVPPL